MEDIEIVQVKENGATPDTKLENDAHAIWLRRRKKTTIMFIVFGFLVGVEYSAVVLSMWFFIRDYIKVDNPYIYYSIAMASMALSASIGSILFGRYVDKTRNIRKFMLITIGISIIGNLVYTLHFSVWLPILGRFLCGISDSITASISGELSRVYPQEKLVVILSKYQAVYAVGFVIGPASGLLFKKVDIQIGSWILNDTNFIGIFMALCLSVFNIFVYFYVSNLSNEMKFKSLREDGTIEMKKLDEEQDVEVKKCWTLKDVVSNKDILLVMISAGLLNFLANTVDLLVPILSSEVFGWKLWLVSVIIAVTVVIFTIIMFTCFKKIVEGNSRVYLLYMLSIATINIGIFLLMIVEVIKISSLPAQITTLSITILLNNISGFQGIALSKAIVLQLTPSHSASFSEGVRNAVNRIFGLLGFFLTGLIAKHLVYFSPIMLVLNGILLGLLLLKFNENGPRNYKEKISSV